MFEPGEPVRYRMREFVFVRYMPGFPRQVVIRDDEGEELRVREDQVTSG
jgi:hypothetical protein